jgi:hypothetical protein
MCLFMLDDEVPPSWSKVHVRNPVLSYIKRRCGLRAWNRFSGTYETVDQQLLTVISMVPALLHARRHQDWLTATVRSWWYCFLREALTIHLPGAVSNRFPHTTFPNLLFFWSLSAGAWVVLIRLILLGHRYLRRFYEVFTKVLQVSVPTMYRCGEGIQYRTVQVLITKLRRKNGRFRARFGESIGEFYVRRDSHQVKISWLNGWRNLSATPARTHDDDVTTPCIFELAHHPKNTS